MINKIQPYEKLVNYVKANPQKGLTIPHADIEQIIGVPYRKSCTCLNSKYTYHVARANEKLTVLSLRLEPIPGFGYRIIKDNQYVDSMRKSYNMGVKYIEKAKFIADSTNTTTLSVKELKEFNDVLNKITTAQNSLRLLPTRQNTSNNNTP